MSQPAGRRTECVVVVEECVCFSECSEAQPGCLIMPECFCCDELYVGSDSRADLLADALSLPTFSPAP